jgi:hypothetical protein
MGGVKTPEIILTCICGIFQDTEGREIPIVDVISFLSDTGEAFAKPSVESGSGRGCTLVCFQNGIDILSGKSVQEILVSLGNNFVIQKRIHCHESISTIYAESVNTFRVITYRWKDKYYHMPITMRIGQGGKYLDNAHAGGMFIAIDDDGTLHKTARTEFKTEYTAHPDTGVVFDGYKIDLLPNVIEAAERMCLMVPQVGSINWDFTIGADGSPIVIEANMEGGSIWLSEMAHGCSPFGERTSEVLRWINLMKRTPASQRYKYQFGKME